MWYVHILRTSCSILSVTLCMMLCTYIILGGGIWRVKWRENCTDRRQYIAAACMHGGSGIYLYSDESTDDNESRSNIGNLSCVSYFADENENRLVYGMDWVPQRTISQESGEENLSQQNGDSKLSPLCTKESIKDSVLQVVTCSFYDNLVQAWSTNV
jgi:hypothetical protein